MTIYGTFKAPVFQNSVSDQFFLRSKAECCRNFLPLLFCEGRSVMMLHPNLSPQDETVIAPREGGGRRRNRKIT